ncbi:hypothetical protein E4T47_06956 [Aureobasidium subglaciale]|nr:hypothetical protein E4T47_06956 [Aureobasidium subglaciale]
MGWSTHASGTQDPPEVRNWKIHLVAFVASMSALAMSYDTSVIGGTMALDSFRRDFGLASASPAHHDTAGCFFGALLTFSFAEKYGRRLTVMAASAVFLVGATLMTAANGKMNMVIAGRAVAGLGIGSCSLVVPVYISETAPPSIRGRLIGIFEIASQGGGMLGFWINYTTDQTISVNNKAQWVVPLGLQLVPGVVLCGGMFFCPESPRWLARSDNFDKAEMILSNLRDLPPDHPYSFTGVNIITYYAPRIFESLGVPGTSLKLFSTGFYGISKTLGIITFTMVVVERVGRRKGLIWGAALGCVPMLYIGGYVLRADPIAALEAGDTSRNGWGYLAMVCVYVNAFIISSEILPLDIRMLCVALTTADTWLGSFIIARSTPYMISDLGYGAYFFFDVILIAMGIWAFFFVPETKGLGITLEEMDALFARSVRKAVWAQLRDKSMPPMGEDLILSEDAKKDSTARVEKVEL